MSSFKESFTYAFNGFKLAISEKHFKVHLLAAAIVTAAGFYFHITQTEWVVCIILFALVIALEIVNTSIERLVDMVSPEQNPKAGAVKDLAAAAVLVAAIASVICAVIIFGKYILALFQS